MIRFFFKFLLVLLLCSGFNYASGQNNTGTIKGSVQDLAAKTNIEFATVSVFKTSDSSLVTGTISDIQGTFELTNVANGNYYIEIGFIGFETKTINSIQLDKQQNNIELGVISLATFSKNMDEFNVVEERDFIETKIDKKIYNVAKDVGAQGDNGLEVLRNIPSVDVDDEDNISLRGDQSVKILIDGRPSPITASQLLKQIPASSIEKIEIITNPSAKYDPEGMSGILNVILKKEKASGFNGNINGGYTYNDHHGYNSSMGLNFRKNKFNVFTNFGYYKGTWAYSGIADRRYITNDSLNYQTLTDIGANKHTSLWVSGGVDYFLNKKNTLYFVTSTWGGEGDRFDDNHYDFADNNNIIQSYSDRYSNKLSDYRGYRYNVGWQTKFKDDNHTLDLDLNYTINEDNLSDVIEERFYNTSNTEIKLMDRQNTSTNGNNYNFDAKIDYVLPITDSLELEMGVITSFQYKESEFYSESNDTFDIITPDTNLNNNFIYDENVTAFYATFGKQFNKIGIKLGVRLENTVLNTELTNTQEKYTQDYLSLFPSTHLSYKIKEGNEFQISYSRRINRPSPWEVNPFASFSDPYNLWIGNPALKPEFIDVYELTYLRFWDKFNFNSSIYYRYVNDKKNRLTELNSQGITVTTPQNLATAQIRGGELIVGYKPYKWWRTNANFNIWKSKVQDDNLDQITGETYGWSVQLTSTQTIKKDWTFQVRGKYRGESQDLQGYTYPRYDVNVSVSKKVLKDKGKISVRYRDIFNTRGWHYKSFDLGNYSFESDRKWTSQSLNISFNYTFGKMNFESQKRQQKSSNSSDSFNSGSSGGDSGQ